MKMIWAPWRMNYIGERREKGCIFCKKPVAKKDEQNLILYRGSKTFVIMNKFPYNNGHLMVVPKRHCTDLEGLTINEFRELFDVVELAARVLRAGLHPHGFNIGINLGKAAGAGKEHLHVHVVPRWLGDSNFMPALAETKVMPQHLDETYRKLRSVFEDLGKKPRRLERRRKT